MLQRPLKLPPTLGISIILALALASCATTPQPDTEGADNASRSADANPDEQLARIAERLPNFGGFFFDDEGVLTVYLIPTVGAQSLEAQSLKAQRANALSALRDVLGEARLERAAEGLETQKSAPDIRVLEGDYTVRQLLEWQARLGAVLELKETVFIDLDEAKNRLVVGVEQVSERLEQALNDLDIPRDAVMVEETEPFTPQVSLRDAVGPTQGGLEINFPVSSNKTGQCTLGFHVIRASRPGFITNSHCTKSQGGTEGTTYTQPNGRRIAVEAKDPGYFRGGKCPGERRCRYSDSAFAGYSGSSAFALGRIAKTTGVNSGSLTISGSGPFRITGEADSAIVGETLNKIGRTTGWTAGKVTRTCLTTTVNNKNIALLCQNLVSANVGGGDSGSPVFKRGKSGRVTLYGILWGGNSSGFLFSPMKSIERELGQLNTRPATVSRVRAKTLSGNVYNLRSGPGTNYRKVGTIGGGYTVVITCQERGEAVTGPYGTTRLWNKLKNGKWITDAYIYSGSNGRLAKAC